MFIEQPAVAQPAPTPCLGVFCDDPTPSPPLVTPKPTPTKTPDDPDPPDRTEAPSQATPSGPKPPPDRKGGTPSTPPRFEIPDTTSNPRATPVVTVEKSGPSSGAALAGLIVSGVMIAAAGLIWRRYLA